MGLKEGDLVQVIDAGESDLRRDDIHVVDRIITMQFGNCTPTENFVDLTCPRLYQGYSVRRFKKIGRRTKPRTKR